MGTIFPTQKSTKTLKKTDNSAMSALNKYKNDIAQKGDYLKAQKLKVL